MEILLDRIKEELHQDRLVADTVELGIKFDLVTAVSEAVYSFQHRRLGDEIFLNGDLAYRLTFTCARCLNQFDKDYKEPLDLVIELVTDDLADDPQNTSEGFICFPKSQKVFDLSSLVREQIILSVPLKPLCREDCLGLCSFCGTNLNETKCSCNNKSSDPRWEGLQKLVGN